jgi:hypothetical protein
MIRGYDDLSNRKGISLSNTTIEMGQGQRDGLVYGDMWIPVARIERGHRRNGNEHKDKS